MEWLLWAAAVVVGIALASVALDRLTSPPRKAVLPAHYDPTNYAPDPAAIPGRCVHCETRNDPDYRYCGNCGAELPDAEPVPATARDRPFGEG